MWTTSPVWENIQRQTDWQWTSQCGAQTAIGPLLTKLIRRRTRCCCHSSTTASRCSTSRGPRRPDPTVARARPPPPTRRARLLGRRKRARDDDHACPDLPSQQRLLGRIHVARGFTAYQHYGAVCDLPTAVNKSIRTSTADSGAAGRGEPSRDEDTSPHTPALIVAPAVDAQYRADDTLGETHAETLQARTLARLATYADGYDIPVLVTRNERNEFTEPVATVADHHLECEQTRMGPRVVGEDFETLVYPVDDGAYYQTTFAYWQQLLAARATQVGVEPTTPAPSTPTPEGVGTGVTADGETVAATADPLLDAWTATGTGGR